MNLFLELIIMFSQGYIKQLIDEKFSDHSEVALRDPVLYGDYRNAMTEEPRLYEDVVDYNATKAIFEEVWFFSSCVFMVF